MLSRDVCPRNAGSETHLAMVVLLLEPVVEREEYSRVATPTDGAKEPEFRLDFHHFCRLSQAREDIPYDELTLAYRFQELDAHEEGLVSVSDYTHDSLVTLLKRQFPRLRDLLRAWDEQCTGHVSLQELRKTIHAIGFKSTSDELDAVLHRLEGFLPESDRFCSRQLIRTIKNEIAMNTPLPEVSQAERDAQAAAVATSVTSEKHLRELIARNMSKVLDLFHAWDEDGSGTINHSEFWVALCSLGLDVPKAAADHLFDKFDSDGSSEIEYAELKRKLTRQADLDDKLRSGSQGNINIKAKNRNLLRQSTGVRGVTLRGVTLDHDKSATEQLIDAMQAAKTRILSLFQEWDSSGDGTVTRRELGRALRQLGLADGDQGRAAVEELFERIDKDRSGTIDFRELLVALGSGNATDKARVRKAAEEAGSAHPAQITGGWYPKQRVTLAPVNQTGATWDASRGCFLRASGSPVRQAPSFGISSRSLSGRFYAPRHERQPTLPASAMRLAMLESVSSQQIRAPSRSILRTSASEPALQQSMRKQPTSRSLLSATVASTDRSLSLSEQIVEALTKSKQRVLRLFQEWDQNGDGYISRDELHRAVLLLGLVDENDARSAVDDLFSLLDRDGSGNIEMTEFFRSLRVTTSRPSSRQPPLHETVSTMPEIDEVGLASPATLPPHPHAYALRSQRAQPSPYEFAAQSLGASAPSRTFGGANLRSLARSTSMLSFGASAMLPPPKELASRRARAPTVQPGKEPSLRRRPPSLPNLRAAAREDEAWFKKALDARILPAPTPSRVGMPERTRTLPPYAVRAQAGGRDC